MTGPVFDQWLEANRDAYLQAKGARLGELRGKRIRTFDAMGLHPESLTWGRIRTLEDMEPWLTAVGTYAEEMRQAAREDAEREFREEILLGAVVNGDVEAPEQVAA